MPQDISKNVLSPYTFIQAHVLYLIKPIISHNITELHYSSTNEQIITTICTRQWLIHLHSISRQTDCFISVIVTFYYSSLRITPCISLLASLQFSLFRMYLVYKFGLHRQTIEFDECDESITIRIKIFNSLLQKVHVLTVIFQLLSNFLTNQRVVFVQTQRNDWSIFKFSNVEYKSSSDISSLSCFQ